ncbi:MAG: hypothetical protein OEY11_14625 [Gammaproteobacteria bacterium]|nr:hypothetical protein [Gammaproteobacteria bacterium]
METTSTLLREAPAFIEALNIMAHDNNIPLKPVDSWPMFINYKLMQEQASSFTQDELETFVTGELSEIQALTKKNKCDMLSIVLNEIFDGTLHDFFCEL